MKYKIAATLLCTAAPVALTAQDVDLRSPDEFLSVEGQIVGFNGVMLRVETSVGAVSVPASEVICYGEGCLEIVANNDFGLTADAFQNIVASASGSSEARDDNLTVAFATPNYGTLYTTLSGAFAVTSNDTIANLSAAGQLAMQDQAGSQSATISVSEDIAGADIVIENAALNGTGSEVFSGPADWAAGNGLTHQMVGMNAYSVMVAPNANISALSMNDLARIFAGEVTNWSQIGGADVNVLPLQLPTNSAVGQEINALVMEPAGKTFAGNVLTMADQAGITGSINQFPGSVSVVSMAAANPDLTVPVSGSCGIVVAPTPFNVSSGDYPLVGAIVATYGAPQGTGLVTELFDFASSDIAQGLIADDGFTSHNAIAQPAAEKNSRLSGLLGASLDDAQRVAAAQKFQVLFDADRMSPTMVGGAVSGPEGAWNRAMMLDLVSAMADPANVGREVIFVGQGDGSSNSQSVIDASIAAAETIKLAVQNNAADVIASANLSLSHYGFGNVSPATCIDGQVARSDYTRVEVWIR